ncbi:MAG: lactate utilization protein B [Actinomycetales bacterium]
MSGTFVGMPTFPVAARTALNDSQLRANLAFATSSIRAKRAEVVSEVDNWEELRLAGAAIKDNTLAHLDDYLVQLEESLTRAGTHVHWARDAAEACAIVAEIARGHGVDEVVKVKSMATQEIDLNTALEQQGIAAWETDLAELIVQLGQDLPSHILVPAIHRGRAEVREIFLRRMGEVGRPAPADLTDEPAVLAAAAREHLREKFLRAKMAVSGANFAVAETGTLVVVESEGNGRMCLTLPEVLVSVVGIEKVVPAWADLDVFLQLLPRSSTGERMNPYTSTWCGPAEGDGPQEMHVVLLDNGRTNALGQDPGRQALRCIRCSACLNVCPVYERVGGHAYGSVYPGPIGAILNPLLKGVGDPQTDSLPYASTLCGRCFEVCPVRIDIPSILVDLRAQVVDAHRDEGSDDGTWTNVPPDGQAPADSPATVGAAASPGGRVRRATARILPSVPKPEALAMKAAAWAFGDARRLDAVEKGSSATGGLLNRVLRHAAPGGRRVLESLPFPGSMWTAARDLPAPADESFRTWWRNRGKDRR